MANKSVKDPHTEAAAKIYGVPPKKVTRAQRIHAKMIGFLYLYGSSKDRLKKLFEEQEEKHG